MATTVTTHSTALSASLGVRDRLLAVSETNSGKSHPYIISDSSPLELCRSLPDINLDPPNETTY